MTQYPGASSIPYMKHTRGHDALRARSQSFLVGRWEKPIWYSLRISLNSTLLSSMRWIRQFLKRTHTQSLHIRDHS